MGFSTLNIDVDRYLNPFVPRPRLHLLPKPISWFLGYREKPRPKTGNVVVWWWAFLGGFLSILIIEAVFKSKYFELEHTPLIIASLGAAAILEFNTIESPLAQPRNCMLGQVLSSFVGVAITKLFQLNTNFENLRWISGALSVGVASAIMGITNTIHPPAGATALLASSSAEITKLGWYLIPLIMLGNSLMLGVACMNNNIQRQFPIYWWTAANLAPAQPLGDTENPSQNKVPLPPDTWQNPEIRDARVVIDDERIILPSWMELEPEETAILEVLQVRIQHSLVQILTRTTDQTRVSNVT